MKAKIECEVCNWNVVATGMYYEIFCGSLFNAMRALINHLAETHNPKDYINANAGVMIEDNKSG